MDWILGIAALCVIGLLALSIYLWRKRKDRRRGRIPGVRISGYVLTPEGEWVTATTGHPAFTPEELAEARAAADEAEPVLPLLAALDEKLAVRLDRSPEFDELQQFFGGYFNQDWDGDYDNEVDVIRGYLDDNAHLPEDVDELRKEMDALLAFGLSDQSMCEALDVLGSYYIPKDATAWVRSVRARLD